MDKISKLKIFGLNLKLERIRLGLTQEQVAEKLDFSTVYISNIESGKCDLSLMNGYIFAKFYGKSIEYLLTEKD